MSCETIYSKMYNQMWYSSLDHSVAVALIIWNFTKDKKQTLSGLFHDIATPVFKHTIDFMNKDYEKQESTEELTTKIISESTEIMNLLKRDGIKLEEVSNYHIYPIADNDTPMLSSDRLEYTLSNGLGSTERIWGLKEINEIYKNIEIDDMTKEEHEEQSEDVSGINLKGTYNQNDLTIIEKRATKDKVEITYCQINGLNNNVIQNNINKELENVAINIYKDKITNLDEVINVSVNEKNVANFSNTQKR